MDGITLGAGDEPCAIAAAGEALGIGRPVDLCADLVRPAVAVREPRAVGHGVGAD